MTVHYAGGYYSIAEPIVRKSGPNAHTAGDLDGLSEYAINSLNYVQETAFKVNPFVHDVIAFFAKENRDVLAPDGSGDVILRLEKPKHPMTFPQHPDCQMIDKEEWTELTKEQKQELKGAKAATLTEYEEQLAIQRGTVRTIRMANTMKDHDTFYFPHNLDFRTRMYPIPSDLSTQSNDLSKGLLAFRQGTALGQEGLYWMGVTLASHWGEDKLPMDDRNQYALDHLEEWTKYAEAPLIHRGWLGADSPFLFLAVLHEFVWANRQSDPTSFVSFLPANMDGSCNGAQHLSVMMRDTVGATATNCCEGMPRQDLYGEVGARVWAIVKKEANEGNHFAIKWRVKMKHKAERRKIVKRSVMTVPYGVTEYGVAEFMIKDKHVDPKDKEKWPMACYMRDRIIQSIDQTLSKGRELQGWLMRCATLVAEAGQPLCWDTPAGSKVTQAYRNLIEKRIRSFGTRFVIYEEQTKEEEEEDFHSRVGMDVEAMGTRTPPNVTHSCDASHLQITVCRMYEAGVRNFFMIHDSFGCPFAQVGLMNKIIREAMVDMYREDYMQKWKASVEKYSGVQLPEPPERGDFNINEILNSEFFFS